MSPVQLLCPEDEEIISRDKKAFQLYDRLNTDPDFQDRISKRFEVLADMEDKSGARTPGYSEKRDSVIADTLKDCDTNFSLLIPYFFPNYIKRRPMNMLDRPFNIPLMFAMAFWLIVLRGSRQIGKTTTLGTRQRAACHLIDNFRTLYVAPHQKQVQTYARKFEEICRAFRHPVRGSKLKQNMYYRQFPNGSEAELLRINTSANDVRGKTYDDFLGDEMQGFDAGLETEVLQVLNDSDIKSIMYTGTSTTTDTLLEERFCEGTQGVWQVFKEDGSTIDCGDPEEVIPYISQYGFIDPKTGREIDPLNGFYKYKNPGAFIDRIFSVHIPQIINPSICKDALEWERLWRILGRDKNKFIQECLGIPLEEANRELTKKDLQRVCVLPEGPDARKTRARSGYYKLIVSGCDWGGSDHNPASKTKLSYTAHVILGVTPENRIHILHFKRHSGMKYTEIMDRIMIDHHAYNAGPIATEFGVGDRYHALMRTHQYVDPQRHIIFHYTGPGAVCTAMDGAELSNTFNLNRTESITSLIISIVQLDPYLLAPGWDESEDYMMDFMNIYRVLGDQENGARHFRYLRNPAKSDDIVHAINMANSLIRLATNQMLIKDPALAAAIRDIAFGGTAGAGFSAGDPYSRMAETYIEEGQPGYLDT